MLLTLGPGKGRLLVLDSLRGLLLVLLAVDHYGGSLRLLTYEPLGFVSAAEGFIFLAGLMVGLIYTTKMSTDPRRAVYKLYGRTFKIYLTYAALLLTFWLALRLAPTYAVTWRELLPPNFTAGTATLLGIFANMYQTSYLGILPLYVMLFLAAPLFLWLFTQGYARPVLVASILLYLVQPLGPDQWLERLFRDNFYNFFTWNILFVSGIYFGYRAKRGTLRVSFRPRYVVSAVTVAVTLFVLRELLRFGLAGSFGYELKLAFTREYLSPLRLANFFLLVYLLVGLAQLKPRWVQNRWLAFLGQHSLYVFAFHGLALYFVWPYIGGLNRELESVLFVASLSLPAWLHERWQRIRLRPEPTPQAGSAAAIPTDAAGPGGAAT